MKGMEQDLLNVIATLENRRAYAFGYMETEIKAKRELEKQVFELTGNLMSVRNDFANELNEKGKLRFALAAESCRRIALEEQIKELKARKQKRAKGGRFA